MQISVEVEDNTVEKVLVGVEYTVDIDEIVSVVYDETYDVEKRVTDVV